MFACIPIYAYVCLFMPSPCLFMPMYAYLCLFHAYFMPIYAYLCLFHAYVCLFMPIYAYSMPILCLFMPIYAYLCLFHAYFVRIRDKFPNREYVTGPLLHTSTTMVCWRIRLFVSNVLTDLISVHIVV